MAVNHRNFAQTTLAAAITDISGTSITVTSETSFPAAPFIISIDTECLLVTVVNGTTWTVTRGYESSTAATHTNGTAIYHDISAAEADSIATKKTDSVSATDKVLGRSSAGAGPIEEIACTAAGRALLDDANAAAQLATLGALPAAGGTVTGDITLDENVGINLDPAGSADEKWSGITVTGTAGATLAVGDLCYLNSSWQWALANASAASTSGTVVLGICLTAASDTQSTRMLLMGTMRSAAFPASITGGAQLYVSATAGDMTTTQPSTTDYVIRCVGWAITTEPNTIFFCPSADYITHV